MTFIASVVARKGVALIADSLVTSSRPVLDFEDFYQYVTDKKREAGDGKITIDDSEVTSLFRLKPSHTKDYQEKLFKYDAHTAVMIAGAANLNGKSLGEVIIDASKTLQPSKQVSIHKKVEDLCTYLESEVLNAVNDEKKVRFAVLIVTAYSAATRETSVYKIFVNETRKQDLTREGFKPVNSILQPPGIPVVCEGQYRISENILFGAVNSLYEAIPRVARRIFKDFNISPDTVPSGYFESLFQDREIMTPEFLDDIKMNKIFELSLQQAVDLACLLLKIERDMQRYTENIPTVGGVVKIAIIDDNGFEFLSGNDIKAIDIFK